MERAGVGITPNASTRILCEDNPLQIALSKSLPEERVSADGCHRDVEDQAGPRLARVGDAAGKLRHGGDHADAVHGDGAEGGPGTLGADPARGVHDQPGPLLAPGFPRDDGGYL